MDTETPQTCHIHELIQILQTLQKTMSLKGEFFRAKAYQKAIQSMMSLQKQGKHIYTIQDLDILKDVKGIGETIQNKCKEYMRTGTLKAIEREKTNPLIVFSNVYGIGPKKAKELVEKEKLHSIEELYVALETNPKLLNDTQRIGLKYYNDILQRIPRKEIEEYEICFRNILDIVSKSTPFLEKFEIVGSYRRHSKDSGDIDVIFTNSNGDSSLLDRFVEECLKQNIIVELLSKGSSKSLLLCKLPQYEYCRRVDFLYSPPHQFPFAILYFTGSALFNTAMRQRALEMGYTLNEHEFCRVSKHKIKGSVVEEEFTSEKDIFDFLQMKYKEPHERIDGNSVEIVSNNTINPTQLGGNSRKGFIHSFRNDGLLYLQILNENEIVDSMKQASEAYYNGQPFLTDSEYDIIKDYVETNYPKNKILQDVGFPVQDVHNPSGQSTKTKLPFYMGSMNKIKPNTDALEKFKKKYKGNYVLSTKLDGISALYDTRHNRQKLYTRGNGSIGQDISHLIPYLKLTHKKGIVLRGELIIKKDIFEKEYASNNSNARNFVGGVVNSKVVSCVPDELIQKIKNIDFVSYELIVPIKRPSKQFEYMKKHCIQCALFEDITENELTNIYLSSLLVDWRKKYPYEIDGVICTHDKAYVRKVGKNPDYSFAFKTILSEQLVEATVVDVIWTPSKDGLLKPRVRIEPVMVNGVKIEYATGFNASFIEDKKIGVGAVIQLVRSGDVIPHILDVLKPAMKVKMPSVEYVWNDSHVDIQVVSKHDDAIVKEKNIAYFFKGLGIEGLGNGNIRKIMKSGFTSVKDIIQMSYDDFLSVDGFKEKMANKLHSQIQNKVHNAPLYTLISVSNVFGGRFGEKKVKKILENYPDIFSDRKSNPEKIKTLESIDGIAKKSATSFVKELSNFIGFMESIGLKKRLTLKNIKKELGGTNAVKKNTQHPLYDKSIVMSGFRDKELEKKIESVGGVLSNSITKSTFVLLVKDVDEDTNKIHKAKMLDITLMKPNTFEKLYF